MFISYLLFNSKLIFIVILSYSATNNTQKHLVKLSTRSLLSNNTQIHLFKPFTLTLSIHHFIIIQTHPNLISVLDATRLINIYKPIIFPLLSCKKCLTILMN